MLLIEAGIIMDLDFFYLRNTNDTPIYCFLDVFIPSYMYLCCVVISNLLQKKNKQRLKKLNGGPGTLQCIN